MNQTKGNKRLEQLFAWGTFAAITIALFLVFIFAPMEKTMREVQKIFYFHVASGWLGMLAFFVVFVCSIIYLIKRDTKWDIYAYTSAEIGVVFTSIVMVTGPIWARPIWNTWWQWDVRLTSALIMWFLYIAYGMIRRSLGEEGRRAVYAAVFGIIAFIDVPIVFFSIRVWADYQSKGLHPILITTQGTGLAPDMQPAFFFSLFAFTLLYIYLMMRSIKIEKLKSEIKAFKENILG